MVTVTIKKIQENSGHGSKYSQEPKYTVLFLVQPKRYKIDMRTVFERFPDMVDLLFYYFFLW